MCLADVNGIRITEPSTTTIYIREACHFRFVNSCKVPTTISTMTYSPGNRFYFLVALLAIGATFEVVDGKPPSRISGGEIAGGGTFPWMVSISTGGLHGCGGALLSSRHVLSAAHCFAGRNADEFTVRAGFTNQHHREHASEANVSAIISHPDYISLIPDVQDSQNDIAVLVLDRDFNLDGMNVMAIHLPNSPPVPDQHGFISGWGDTNVDPPTTPEELMRAVVRVLSDSACSRWTQRSLSPQLFCGMQNHGNILGGDSGSALVSGGVVIGVASESTGIVEFPDYYVNVYHYRDWILAAMGRV